MDREAWQATVHGITRVGHDLAAKQQRTAEIIYSTAHVCRQALTCTWATFVIWAPPKKAVALLWHHGCVHWLSKKRREYSVPTVTNAASARKEFHHGLCASQERGCVVLVMLALLHQPGENKCVCHSYGSSRLLPASKCSLVQATVHTARHSKTIGVASRIPRSQWPPHSMWALVEDREAVDR